jgi:hypothetical protein
MQLSRLATVPIHVSRSSCAPAFLLALLLAALVVPLQGDEVRLLSADGPSFPRLSNIPGPATEGQPATADDLSSATSRNHPGAVESSCRLARDLTGEGLEDHLCRLEKRMFADAADGRLDDHSLMESALIACGVRHGKQLQGYLKKFDSLVEQLRRECGPKSSSTDSRTIARAQIVFEFMHRHILTGEYSIECTDLRNTLDGGRYNCVSASVLFNCLAERVGLATFGLETTGHAMSRLTWDGGSLDVETTYPRWFKLIDDPDKRAELVAKAIGPSHDGAEVRIRRVSPTGLVAMIYYNRGIDLLAEKHFLEAANANAKALRLDAKSTTARGNLLATINNWAIDLGRTGNYAQAIGMLKLGMDMDPDYETFKLNYVHVHYQWVEQLCKTGKFEDALEVLAAAANRKPDHEYFRQAPRDVYRRWNNTLSQRGEAEKPYLQRADNTTETRPSTSL